MSIPPLVCSTPPPLDQCCDEDDDEFPYSYSDSSNLSPVHQLNSENLNTSNFSTNDISNSTFYLIKNKSDDLNCISDNQEIKFSNPNSKSNDCTIYSSKDNEVYSNFSNIEKLNEPCQSISIDNEENNVEDLDLKFNDLNIDFQNKESVEESLNDSFDDFGTFLTANSLTDTSNTEFYLPKIVDNQNVDISKKQNLDENIILNRNDLSVQILDQNCESFSDDSTLFFTETNIKNELLKDDLKDSKTFIDSCSTSSKSENLNNTNTLESPNSIYNYEIDVSENSDTFNCNVDIVSGEGDVKKNNTADTENVCHISIDGVCRSENLKEIIDVKEENKLNTILDQKNKVCNDFEDFATFQTNCGSNDNWMTPESSTDLVNEVNIHLDEKNNDDKVEISNFNDDFGDFDTYNPLNESEVDNSRERKNNDTDVFDGAFTSIGNLFTEEYLSQEDDTCELKKILGESWSHLMSCESKQSYLFPWNNSASQKSLLRCLGIDSRNILSGCKWNTNIPRFAANLGVNPLQPIKQNIDQNNSIKTDNSDVLIPINVNKENDWENSMQYGLSDFHTSSYAESLLLDLEHLMATLDQMTSGQSTHFKISDLFSNAITERDDSNISHSLNTENSTQPNENEQIKHSTLLNIGRKINLPDTHIFTPTDSETPWSHTIHYIDEIVSDVKNHSDSIPNDNSEENDEFDEFQSFEGDNKINKNDNNMNSIKLSKESLNNESNSTQILSHPESHVNNKNMTDDFDEFGDFQSAEISTPVSLPIMEQELFSEKQNVLEPIKLTPLVPTVNWPEPGEVKSHMFDDFTETDNNISANTISSPFYSTGPQSFILKESKIETENDINTPLDGIFDEINKKVILNEICHSMDKHIGNELFHKSNDTISNTNEYNHSQSANYAFVNSDKALIVKSTEMNSLANINNLTLFNTNSIGDLSISSDNTCLSTCDRPSIQPISISRHFEDYSSSRNSTQHILQPLSVENFSNINWPEPGIDFQDLSRFNPISSLKPFNENVETNTKHSDVINGDKSGDDDGWSDFVSIKPITSNNKTLLSNSKPYGNFTVDTLSVSVSNDNEDWSDFVSNTVPSKNFNELKTISQNIHTQETSKTPCYNYKNTSNYINQSTSNFNILPNLSYVSSKSNLNRNYNAHFQNL